MTQLSPLLIHWCMLGYGLLGLYFVYECFYNHPLEKMTEKQATVRRIVMVTFLGLYLGTGLLLNFQIAIGF